MNCINKTFFKLSILAIYILISQSDLFGQNILIGRIYDDTTKEKLSGVHVYIPELNTSTLSDSAGSFRIKNLPSGNYNLQLSIIGYEPYIKNIIIKDSITKIEFHLESTFLELPEVVIFGSQNSNIKNTSNNITSYSLKEMKENGTVSISDALSRIPGMSQISTGVGISKPVIRGLYGNRIQTVLMGMRFDNQQWQDEHGLGLSDLGVDRIEVIKGPASLLYGSEGMGGVLNVIEEKPAELGKKSIDLNTQFFSNTLGNATNIGIKKATERKSWRIRGGYESHGDYSDGKNNRVLNSRFNGFHLKGSIDYHRSKRITSLNFMSSFSQFGFITDDNIDKKELDARISRKMDGPNHSVFFNVFTVQNTYFKKNSKIKFNIGANSNLRLENEGGNRISLNMLLNTVSSDLQWTKFVGEFSEFTIGTQEMVQTNRNFGSRVIVPDANLWEAGTFAFYKFGKKWITIESGLRYDHKSIKTLSTDEYNPNRLDGFDPFVKSYNVVNGSLGTSILFLESFNWKFNASTGYRAPNLAELSSAGLHEGTFRFELGNTNMKVEQNLNLETSLNYEIKQLSVQANIYRNRLLNYIYLAPTGTDYFGFDMYKFVQKTSTIQGGELELTYNPKPLKNLQFNSSYSFIEGKTDDGHYLPFIPANRINGELKFSFSNCKKLGKPYLKSGVSYVFAQNKAAQFETTTPDYYLVNAGAGGTINFGKTPINVIVSCNNLLNKKYYDHLSRFKNYGIYNIGRNISLNLHIPIK